MSVVRVSLIAFMPSMFLLLQALLEVSLRGNNIEAASGALSALAFSSSSFEDTSLLLEELQAENRQLKSALASGTQRQVLT